MAKKTYAEIAEELGRKEAKYQKMYDEATSDAARNAAQLMLDRVNSARESLMADNQARAEEKKKPLTPGQVMKEIGNEFKGLGSMLVSPFHAPTTPNEVSAATEIISAAQGERSPKWQAQVDALREVPQMAYGGPVDPPTYRLSDVWGVMRPIPSADVAQSINQARLFREHFKYNPENEFISPGGFPVRHADGALEHPRKYPFWFDDSVLTYDKVGNQWEMKRDIAQKANSISRKPKSSRVKDERLNSKAVRDNIPSYANGGVPPITSYINNLLKFQGDPTYPPSVYSNQEILGIRFNPPVRRIVDTGAGIPPSVFSAFETGDGLNIIPPPAYPEITPNAFSPQGVSLENRFAGTPAVVGSMERDGWRGKSPIVDTGAPLPPPVFSPQEGALRTPSAPSYSPYNKVRMPFTVNPDGSASRYFGDQLYGEQPWMTLPSKQEVLSMPAPGSKPQTVKRPAGRTNGPAIPMQPIFPWGPVLGTPPALKGKSMPGLATPGITPAVTRSSSPVPGTNVSASAGGFDVNKAFDIAGMSVPFLDNIGYGKYMDSLRGDSAPEMREVSPLNTTFDINPQLTDAMRAQTVLNRSIDQTNTSRGAANNAKIAGMTQRLRNVGQLQAQKNNAENRLKNINVQRIDQNNNSNRALRDAYRQSQVDFNNQKAALKRQNVVNIVDDLGQINSQRIAQNEQRAALQALSPLLNRYGLLSKYLPQFGGNLGFLNLGGQGALPVTSSRKKLGV